jgi:cell division septation protein DedD
MAGETILVIDADQDLDHRMTAALEAQSYLVYQVSSHNVSAEMAELLRPSLIYLKPLELSPTGLNPCKTIHGIALLKKVPIIIVASEQKTLGPDHFRDYGIVGSLSPTFSPDELIGKTKKMLGETHPSQLRRKEVSAPTESAGNGKTTPPAATEDYPLPRMPKAARGRKSSFFLPAIGAAILLVIAGGGFLIYQQLMSGEKGTASSALIVRSPAPSKAPDAGPKPQVDAKTDVASSSAPGSPKPSIPPLAPSKAPDAGPKPQVDAKTNVTSSSVSALPKPSTPPPAPSKAPDAGPKPQVDAKTNIASSSASASPKPSTPPGQDHSPSATPKVPAKHFYSVQLGAFRYERTAEVLMKELREKGYDAFIQPGVTKDKSPIYRVLVSKHANRKAAQEFAKEIRLKEKANAVLYAE